jgi:hypothetical protein
MPAYVSCGRIVECTGGCCCVISYQQGEPAHGSRSHKPGTAGGMPRIATFGLGYYWVSCDLSKNHDLVRLGAMGKLLVFVVFFGHLIPGNITLRLVLPSLVDLLFGILFLEFLARFKSKPQ